MMTHQDFERFAAVLREQMDKARNVGLDSAEVALVTNFLQDVGSDIADICAGSNGRFDREKFLAACGF